MHVAAPHKPTQPPKNPSRTLVLVLLAGVLIVSGLVAVLTGHTDEGLKLLNRGADAIDHLPADPAPAPGDTDTDARAAFVPRPSSGSLAMCRPGCDLHIAGAR